MQHPRRPTKALHLGVELAALLVEIGNGQVTTRHEQVGEGRKRDPQLCAEVHKYWASSPATGSATLHGYRRCVSQLGRRGQVNPDLSSVTIADLAGFLGKPILGSTAAGKCVVTEIRDDSRAVCAGDAYVAIPGRSWHGLEFEAQAAAAGAVVVISDRPGRWLPSIVVPDPRSIIGPLAAWFHRAPSAQVRVLGVTGTNGKTSTCHFLYAGLAATGQTAGLICGSRIQGPGIDEIPSRTTPEATSLQSTLAQFRSAGVTACAMEVSSHAVSERRVDGTFYRVMAFTNLSRDHLDYHGSMEGYFAAKAALFDTDRTAQAVINIDDPYGARLAKSTSVPTWTCSMTDPSADVHVKNLQMGADGTRFTARTPQGRVPMALQSLGPHQVPNAIVALTTLAADGCDIHAAAAGISSVAGIPGRCERVEAGQDFTAIVDYMHNTAG